MTNELLQQILEVCIIPLLGILTTFLVSYLKKKSAELQTKVDNDTADKYIGMLTKTITDCVLATNQTYVEALKKENAFTAEAQKKAFDMTCSAVLNILSNDCKNYLNAAYGDLYAYITKKIEAEVNTNKKVVKTNA